MHDNDPVASALRQHAQMHALMGRDMPLARLLLAKGRSCKGMRFDKKRMPSKQCFRNALVHAQAHGLAYAEGYALSGSLTKRGLVLPVEHAWCVDGQGRAIDPTWEEPEASFYLGIEFDAADVWKRVERNGTFGVFCVGPASRPDISLMLSIMPDLNPGVVHEEFLHHERDGASPQVSGP